MRIIAVLASFLFILAVIADVTASTTTVVPVSQDTVTIQLPESTGDNPNLDEMVTFYADVLRAEGFTASPADNCECLTGPRATAVTVTGMFTDAVGGVLFERK